MTLLMVHNMVQLAQTLKTNPYRTDVIAIGEKAKQMSN